MEQASTALWRTGTDRPSQQAALGASGHLSLLSSLSHIPHCLPLLSLSLSSHNGFPGQIGSGTWFLCIFRTFAGRAACTIFGLGLEWTVEGRTGRRRQHLKRALGPAALPCSFSSPGQENPTYPHPQKQLGRDRLDTFWSGAVVT